MGCMRRPYRASAAPASLSVTGPRLSSREKAAKSGANPDRRCRAKGARYRVVSARVFPIMAFVSGSVLSHSLGYSSFM